MDARTVFSWVLIALLTVIVWLLVRPFLSWLLATGLLAFLLFPVHRRLEDRIGSRLSAGLLAVAVVVVVVVPATVAAEIVIDEGTELLAGISRAGALERLETLLERYAGVSVSVRSPVQQAAERATSFVSERAVRVLSAGLHASLGFLLLTFVLYYLLKDGEAFVDWLRAMTPLEPGVRDELFESIEAMTWAVLKGHILVAIVQGAVAGFSLFVTGVPNAFVLTAAMMVLAVVPIVGVAPVLGGAIVYLYLNDQLLFAAFVAVWGMTTVAITDDYLRAVLIDRESADMHSAVVLVGVVGGTYLFGAMGLFVGPILLALFKTTIEVLGGHYGVNHLSRG